MTERVASHPEFLVVCLCAEWCGICRDYRAGFEALAAEFPDADFIWLDIEDNAALIDDADFDEFPRILIQRSEAVLFYGTMLPRHAHLRQTLNVFRGQSPQESRAYADGSDERRGWQEQRALCDALRARAPRRCRTSGA